VLALKKILKKIYFSIIKTFFETLYGSIKKKSNSGFTLIKVKFSKESKKEYEVYEIKNARIYTDSSQNVAVIKKNEIYEKLSTQLIDNHLVNLDKNGIIKTGTRKFIQKKIKGNILSLIQGASAIENYGHWLLDTIPKLIVIKKIKDLNSFDAILIPNFKKNFQKDSLEYFDIPKSKILDGSEITHIYADKITIPSHPYWEIDKHQFETVANVDKDILKSIRKIFLKENYSNKIKKNNNIYIDRSDSIFNHNKLVNNLEIIEYLKNKDFLIVKLSEFSFNEQIKLFNSAKIIIGSHGAGLTNIIFSEPSTKIIEIGNPNSDCYVFKNISDIQNLDHSFIKAKPTISEFGDMKIEIKDLKI
tara:strand:- start:836 stop:1915 length:1080 start_codon:yes stop_codon:yes gene_type:complete